MVSNVRPKRILASFLVASAVALYAPVPFAGAIREGPAFCVAAVS